MMSKKGLRQVLAYDLGGTKVAAGVVDETGKVLKELREPVVLEKGKTAVLRQLSALGNKLHKLYPNIDCVGIASAGPLHSETGLLLDPTNFSSKKGRWGRVPIAKILSKSLRLPVYLENDAAAAILAERWVGAARRFDNAMILTLGTGLGTGIITNGKLVRAGSGLHPEAGHIIINGDDPSAPCGCGNLGCGEAYLSGRGFTHRARVKLGDPTLHAPEIARRARKGDKAARLVFQEYAFYMAVAIHNYVMIYEPNIIILTGSFAATSDLFLSATRKHLKTMLRRRNNALQKLPRLVVSKLHNQAGLLGGAYVAFNPHHSR